MSSLKQKVKEVLEDPESSNHQKWEKLTEARKEIDRALRQLARAGSRRELAGSHLDTDQV